MIKIIFLLFLSLHVMASSIAYTKLYSSIEREVSISQQLKNSAFFVTYKDDIDALESCLLESEGYANSDEYTPKLYLKRLRVCEKHSKKLERIYVKALNEAIANKNILLFQRLLIVKPSVLEHNRFVEKSVEFYKSIQESDAFSEGDALLARFNENTTQHAIADKERRLYEADVNILEYSKARSSDKKFFIAYKECKGGYQLIAENANNFDITVHIEFAKIDNYSIRGSRPYLYVIAAQSSTKLVSVESINKRKKSSISWRYSWMEGSINARHDDTYAYAVPFAKGKRVQINQGNNTNKTHNGNSAYAIDFQADIGTKIYAARDGVVVKTESSFSEAKYDKSFASKANFIVIEHDDGTLSQYAHLKKDGVRVHVGQHVQRGDYIGLSGNTGYSSGPHLHFEVFKVVLEKNFASRSIPISIQTKEGVISSFEQGSIIESVR